MVRCPNCEAEIRVVQTRQERVLEGECYLDKNGRLDCHVKFDYPDSIDYFCSVCKESICDNEEDAEKFLKGEEF